MSQVQTDPNRGRHKLASQMSRAANILAPFTAVAIFCCVAVPDLAVSALPGVLAALTVCFMRIAGGARFWEEARSQGKEDNIKGEFNLAFSATFLALTLLPLALASLLVQDVFFTTIILSLAALSIILSLSSTFKANRSRRKWWKDLEAGKINPQEINQR